MKKTITLLFAVFMFSSSVLSQQLKTYSGPFPDDKKYGYMLDATATYTYYTDEDDERIYQGNYEMKFHGEGSTNKVIRRGKTKGKYENNKPVGEWTVLYPMHLFDFGWKQYYVHFKCNMVNGEPDGTVELVINNSAVNASTANALSVVVAEYKNGVLNGPFSLINKDKSVVVIPAEIKGEFRNGKKIGRWDVLLSNKDKGVVVFDEDGYEAKGYRIDYETGEKSKYELPLMHEWMDFGSINWYGFIRFIKRIRNSSED